MLFRYNILLKYFKIILLKGKKTLLNIKPFKYIYNVEKYGTIREAADKMFVTQPTISQQIKKLEETLGFPIFEKRGRKIQLTSQGEELYPFIHDLIVSINKLEQNISSIQKDENNNISLGLGPVLPHDLIKKVLVKFNKEYPDKFISIIESGSIELLNLLKNKEIDFAIINTNNDIRVDLSENNIVHNSLFNSNFLLMTSSNHILAKKETVSFKDIKNESLMLYKNGIVQKSLLQLLNSENKQNIFLSFVEYTSIINLVRDNMGVSIVPASLKKTLSKEEKKGISFLNFHDFGKSIEVSYIYKDNEKKASDAKAFLLVLDSYIK